MISEISFSLIQKHIIVYANLRGVVAVATHFGKKKLIRYKDARSNKVTRHETCSHRHNQFFLHKIFTEETKDCVCGIKRQRRRPMERGPRALPAFDISASVAG